MKVLPIEWVRNTLLALERYAQWEIPAHGTFVMPPITWRTGLLLEQYKDLGHDEVVVQHHPSTCASAASVWGNQKVISMAR